MTDMPSSLIATLALKRLAATPAYREMFLACAALRDFLRPAALRYIISEDRAQMLDKLAALQLKGYRTGLEYVGEEANTLAEVQQATEEYLRLIDAMSSHDGLQEPTQLGFDLSNVGSLISRELALENCNRILARAAERSVGVIISMERSQWTDSILDIFLALSRQHSHLGITLQAQLNRTADDLEDVLKTGCKVRLVKGVYSEPAAVALPRGEALDQRYLGLLERIRGAGIAYAFATQDPSLVQTICASGLADGGELEMLHGVRPQLIKSVKDLGRVKTRVSAVYGTNWYLHLLHRIAEFPENIFLALDDVASKRQSTTAASY
ncbi:proline dehydrogenase family protein [Pseudomonas sp. MPFS]|uniref:proline dehydrogenase family protein n=1 Tax=Pseudomonas sp. MPFS TaxID=2795724 RepID=UPI001F1365B4|nr:proline dehydrogenase family protein [Pseudomonas sp. MPFS]UMZ10983.1 proline dehydrogenase family protein [Pseudomonas sp. MPFS]